MERVALCPEPPKRKSYKRKKRLHTLAVGFPPYGGIQMQGYEPS